MYNDTKRPKKEETMTLQQLRYVVTIAEIGTISKAAEELFVSQPSLTKALKELEKEMQITIFDRTNKGIHVSREGEIFLGYARQVLEQAALIEEKYKHKSGGKQEFCISTQHYSFAVNAFVDLIKEYGSENYDFSLRETQTYEIIDDVARMKSEIGILYLNEFNASVLEKIMKANDLKFTELFVARPHILSVTRTHWHRKIRSQWKISKIIRICHLSRGNIILSIILKRCSVRKCVQRTFE